MTIRSVCAQEILFEKKTAIKARITTTRLRVAATTAAATTATTKAIATSLTTATSTNCRKNYLRMGATA